MTTKNSKDIRIYRFDSKDQVLNYKSSFDCPKGFKQIFNLNNDWVLVFYNHKCDLISSTTYKVHSTIECKQYFHASIMKNQDFLFINDDEIVVYNISFRPILFSKKFSIKDIEANLCVEHNSGSIFTTKQKILKIYSDHGELKKKIESKTGIGTSLLNLKSSHILTSYNQDIE